MKKKSTSPASIAKARWVAYAAAGAATALGASHSAECAIHYSGIIKLPFPPFEDNTKTFPLDQPGDFISFERAEVGTSFFNATNIAYFRIFGIAAASFRGFRSITADYRHYVSRLPLGSNVSGGGPFTAQPSFPGDGGILASARFLFGSQEWQGHGGGFVGFRFDSGAGLEYGWARVRMMGLPENAFKVMDYAYADPGEPIRAGQTSNDEQAVQQDSLGWLALGAAGLLAWRKSRVRNPQ
jgi:hypothetical protein